MTVSVMITTIGRFMDLRRTWRALQQLDPPPLEVLITLDGCAEDVIAAVKAELSGARVFVNEIGLGSVASRDRMMHAARGDLVLALDDDSYPEQLDCVARIVPRFEQQTNLAVLHFPQRTDEYPETLAQTDFGPERLTCTFPNSGAVLRRSTYLQLAGFESRFFHAYEEPDYALQCVASVYDVLFSPVVTIRHH
jgi:GT2 family glycosyltransferase